MFGLDSETVFLLPELQLPENQAALLRPDTVLIDRLSCPEFGPQTIGLKPRQGLGRVIGENGGQYTLRRWHADYERSKLSSLL